VVRYQVQSQFILNCFKSGGIYVENTTPLLAGVEYSSVVISGKKYEKGKKEEESEKEKGGKTKD
jgi:hypothetical protein